MSGLVVDASAALHVASAPRGFAALASHDLVAPALMWSEAVSSLRSAIWRGEASPALGSAVLDALLTAPIERKSPKSLHREAMRIATELGWAKTYDAEYVALARILGFRLLTLDGRLKRGAARIATIVGPADL